MILHHSNKDDPKPQAESVGATPEGHAEPEGEEALIAAYSVSVSEDDRAAAIAENFMADKSSTNRFHRQLNCRKMAPLATIAKEAKMGMTVPTPDDVRDVFRKAIGAACRGTETLTSEEFKRHHRSTLNPIWTQCLGVEAMYIDNEIRLVRVTMMFRLDSHGDGQLAVVERSIDVTASALRSVLPPQAVVDFMFEFEAERDAAGEKDVSCRAIGVVRS